MSILRRKTAEAIARPRMVQALSVTLLLAFASAADGAALGSPASAGPLQVRHYALDLSFDAGSNTIHGNVAIQVVSRHRTPARLALDMAANLSAQAVSIDGRPAAFFRRGAKLIVELPAGAADGPVHALRIVYAGAPGTPHLRFDTVAGNPAIASYGMPYSAGSWWPTFDEPSSKATGGADITVVAPPGDSAVSNGILVDAHKMRDGRTRYHWRESYPIYPDVISVAIGPYTEIRSEYRSISGRRIPLTYYVFAADARKAQSELADVPRLLRTYESLFGPYPFQADKYGIAEMTIPSFREHQTIPSLGRGLILGTSPVWDLGDVSNVIAHDLAHQWFGDSLTPRQWSDVWLNEGFANYAVALWHERQGGDAALRQFMRSLDTGPFQGPVYLPPGSAAGALLTDTTFNKGAWILHMLRHVMGDARYFAAVRDYVRSGRGGLVDTHGWIAVCERHYGRSLTWFFNEWLYGEGRPALRLAWHNSQRPPGRVSVIIEQVQPGRAFEMPVDLEIQTSAGSQLRTVWLRGRTQELTLTASRPVSRVVLDPDGWLLKR